MNKLDEIINFCIIKNLLKYKDNVNLLVLNSNIIGFCKLNSISFKKISEEELTLRLNKYKTLKQNTLKEQYIFLLEKIKQPIKNNEVFKTYDDLTSQKNIFRFAPNPNFEPTIANLRGLYLNYKISTMYTDSKLYLRFDDTNPDKCRYLKTIYKSYIDACNWLNIKIDKIMYASKRLPLYYEKMKELLDQKIIFVNVSKNKQFIIKKNIAYNKLFRKNKKITIIDENNTVLFRNLNKKPFLWPTLRFQGCIDDIIEKTTCIIRGKDLMSLEIDQKKWSLIFNTQLPKFIYWGRNKINNIPLSSSYMYNLVTKTRKNAISLNLPCFSSLKYYEINPLALKKWFDEIGLTQNDTFLNIEILKKYNKLFFNKSIDTYFINSIQNIYFAVEHITNIKQILYVDTKFRKYINNNNNTIFKFNLYNNGFYKINNKKIIKLLL